MTDTRETRRGDEATDSARGGVCPCTEREPMTEPRFRLSLPTCFAAVCLALAIPGQELIVAQDSEPPPLLVSIDFPGGTVTEFVSTIRRALPPESKDPRAAMNLLVGANAGGVSIPPMTVRNAELETLFNVATALITPRYYLEIDRIDSGNGTPVLVVRAVSNGPETTRMLRVLPLRALTQTVAGESSDLALPAESILTAVQAALELIADGQTPATVRFHESSGLVFVHGTSQQVDTALDVVSQMERDLDSLRRRARAGVPTLSTLLPPADSDPPPRKEGSGR